MESPPIILHLTVKNRDVQSNLSGNTTLGIKEVVLQQGCPFQTGSGGMDFNGRENFHRWRMVAPDRVVFTGVHSRQVSPYSNYRNKNK